MSDETLESRAALERLFNKDDVTVSHNGGVMGDYRIRFHDTCYHEQAKQALSRLGFSEGSTHAHARDDGTAEIDVYVNDTRA